MPRRFSPAPRQPGDWTAADWQAFAIIMVAVLCIEVAIILAFAGEALR